MSDNAARPQGDLSDLINRAQREVKTLQPMQPPGRAGERMKSTAAGIAALGALACTYAFALPWLVGYSDATLRKGLAAIAEAARKDVEAYRAANGSLPEALPSPMLAMAVQYRREGAGYRVRATDGARVVEMDESGAVAPR